MIRVTRRFEFDAAHRLLGYSGDCKNLHGHHYVVEVTAEGGVLDDMGMIVDFGVVKKAVGSWINHYWDHAVLLNPDDPLLDCLEEVQGKCYTMPRGNPTAENMAMVLFKVCDFVGFKVSRVRLYETPDCFVEVER